MNCRTKLDFNSLLEKKVLLYGETNTFKTYCSAKFVQFLLEEEKIKPKRISIIDFAPNLQYIDDLKIGGKIKDYYDKSKLCCYLESEKEIIPPRLLAQNKRQLYENACHNYKQARNLLKKFKKNSTPILLINDISIYLHLGNRRDLMKIINMVETCVGNAYYGENISSRSQFARLFSLNEHFKILHLCKYFDKSILMKDSN